MCPWPDYGIAPLPTLTARVVLLSQYQSYYFFFFNDIQRGFLKGTQRLRWDEESDSVGDGRC